MKKTAEVEYIVGHGIASKLRGQHLVIGSRHFVEEEKACHVLLRKTKLKPLRPKVILFSIWRWARSS